MNSIRGRQAERSHRNGLASPGGRRRSETRLKVQTRPEGAPLQGVSDYKPLAYPLRWRQAAAAPVSRASGAGARLGVSPRAS